MVAGNIRHFGHSNTHDSVVLRFKPSLSSIPARRMRPRNQLLFALWFLALSASNLFAASVKTPHVEAEIISRLNAVQPGQPIEAALRLKIIDHWHTYWRNPGDSGLPTKLTWSLPPGVTAGPIEWPFPKQLPLGPLMNFGYDGEVLHLVKLQTPTTLKAGQNVTLSAKAEWLVCSDVCIPESADLTISLPVVASAPLPDARWAMAFTAANAALPGSISGWTAKATIGNNKAILDLTPPPGQALKSAEYFFYPLGGEIIANAGKQIPVVGADGLHLTIPLADPVNSALSTLEGVLVSDQGWGKVHAGKAIAVTAAVTYAKTTPAIANVKAAPLSDPKTGPPNGNDLGLAVALLFAFIGGLILNLMPCVFPVLGIKVMSFVQHAHGEQKLLRQQGLAFLGGVVISFWVLAGLLAVLRATGESIGWGFQLQSPVFVTLLAMLFLLMALNLSGVFEFGMQLQSAAGNLETAGKGGNRSSLMDAFFSGVLATIIATPCTAPFLGAALGYTLAQPTYVSMMVFTSVALGMAAPIMVLSLLPGWLRYLPKPGAWMESFKQFMAFPLFATVAWLAWVLGSQQGNDGLGMLLFGMVIVAFGAWLYGRWQLDTPVRASVAAILLLLAGAVIAWPNANTTASPAITAGASSATDGWVPFSKQKVAELRGQGRPVFIDFTATWCITCQVNKRIALNHPEVLKRFEELNIVRIRADWTVKDPAITEALAEFGRNGVPLYVFYPVAGDAQILPEVLTPAIVLSAVAPQSIASTVK